MQRDIVVVGASAGGVEALKAVSARLGAAFAGSLFVVLHILAEAESALANILARSSGLPAAHVLSEMPIQPGRIYVAPPNWHIVLTPNSVMPKEGPRQNRHRPSVDTLFRSAARAFGPRVVGVVLTGADDDGAAGLAAIKAAGGLAVIQDPEEALWADMPASALRQIDVDYRLPLAEIGPLLARLVTEDVTPSASPVPVGEPSRPLAPLIYSCPDCGGALMEVPENGLTEYRCAVGHVYSTQGLLDADADVVERALWAAMRSLEESAQVSRRVGRMLGNAPSMKDVYEERARVKEEHARIIRDLLNSL
jgi:two-component system chemotaxis response regulator CheB